MKTFLHKLILVSSLVVAACAPARASGTWAALAHAPPAGLNNGLLLTDGTVMCGDGGSGWYRLTPDIHGSYLNGTWTQLAYTHYNRLFYSSDILTNGNLYVAGGEYGTGKSHAELYNSLLNTWSDIAQPSANPTYSDAISKILPGGNVLQGTTGTGVWIYNVNLNTITAAASSARSEDETCWVKMANDAVLSIDGFGQQAEHYLPALNQWISDGSTPQDLYGFGGELGPGFLLPNGKVFCIGASTHTAIYTPGANASAAGSWISGPEMIFGTNTVGAVDAPAAMMVNGKILCALGPTNGYNGPTTFYEYDYISNIFTQVNGPTGSNYGPAPFVTTMLDLPDGNILFFGGQNSKSLYVYTPDSSPLAGGQPVISNITENVNGSYHLAGAGLTGISGGAAYGDDWQMDTAYPLVRLTNNSTGNVYYARTYSWNTTSLMTGTKPVSTEFTLPVGLPAGTYSLVVTANGNPSAPASFTYSPLPAPTGLSALTANNRLSLSWNSVAGATAYNLLRSTFSGGPYVTVTTQATTAFNDTGLTNGVIYYYVVTAVGSGGPSAYSAQIFASPFGPPPAPTGLIAGPDSYVGINLSWNPSPGAASYNLKRSTTSGGPYTNLVSHANPNYDDTNVVVGTKYFYVVSAVSAGGESANSTQTFATPSLPGDITNGLVANFHLDEGAGTTTADSSSNLFTGTLVNSPTWTSPGRIGPADLSFNATNLQYVTVPSATPLNMTAAITITAWINALDWGGNRRVLQKGNSDNQYRFLAENGVFRFHLNGVNTVDTDLPATGVWVHVAATYTGSAMVIYTNGETAASLNTTGSITTTPDPLAIATKNTSTAAGDCFNGEIDEVRLYNRALTLSEINTVMHAGDAAPTAPTGLAIVASNAQLTLSWNLGSTPGYNVKRSLTNGGPYQLIGSTFANIYTDKGLTNGTTYYYVVSAVSSTNESANSTQVSGKPGIGVAFFANTFFGGAAGQLLGGGNYTLSQLQAAGIPNDSASSCAIPPGWTVVVYQDDNFGGATWTLTGDTPNFTLQSGLNDNMSSCKITALAAPPAPASLTATGGDTQVGLSWNASAGATFYRLKFSTNNGGPYNIIETTTGTNYTQFGLVNGMNYYYVVSAVGAAGEGANSAQVIGTPSVPPVLLTLAAAADGQFVLQFQGSDNHDYIVQSSTDLVTWVPVFTNQTTAGQFIYTNTNSAPTTFFRVQE